MPEVVEWPAGEPRSRSKELAYAALFRAWGAEHPGREARTQAERLGLRCRTARGGLDELRQLNRPAVLSLRDRKGREFYATLTALDDDTATFAVGAAAQSIAVRALATQWTGNYTMLWRLPPIVRDNIWPGERGVAVEWLGTQLALIEGGTPEATPDPVFDDVLVSRVKQFQLAHGLIPDGAVGAQTLMRLSDATDQSAPMLSRAQK